MKSEGIFLSNRDNNKEEGFDAGWIFPIIMTAIFWPVGVFMLLKKYKETQKRAKKNRSYASLMSGGALMAIIGAIAFLDSPDIVPMFLTLGGLFLTGFSFFENRRNAHLRTYLSIIDNRPLVDIVELAGASGRSEATVLKDLQLMLDRGLLPENAYVDHAMNCLVLDPEEMRRARPNRRYAPPVVEAEVVEEPKKAAKAKPAAKAAEPAQAAKPAADDKSAILRETFDAKLREIRYLNDLIDDESVSARIDDIESITANIFYLVQEKPERMEEIRTFMNYYLPTTFKLLNAYARLEKQSVAGDNISHSKKEIEAILDKLVEGFRQQLDRLFQSDAIDISSDIDVLETMMAKDGLLDGGLKVKL